MTAELPPLLNRALGLAHVDWAPAHRHPAIRRAPQTVK